MGIQINGNTDIISATDGSLTIQGASGNLTGNLTGTATTAQGLTGTPNITVGTIGATSLNASGVVTATSFSGSGANLTGIGGTTDVRTNSLVVSGVSTVTDLRVGTAVTANSNGIQVGAGKSVRIFGSTSGFSDIIASSAAGASELLLPNTSGTLDRLNRAGNVLQVVNTLKTDTFSESIATLSESSDVTGLTCSITPVSSSNKILVTCAVTLGAPTEQMAGYTVYCNGSAVAVADAAGSRRRATAVMREFRSADTTTISVTLLHAPASTSQQTYSVRIFHGSGGSQTLYVNRSATDTNSGTFSRGVSTITAMEVAA